MSVVIAIDAGTTGVRAFAVDDQGRPAGFSYREFTQHFPQPGWVEHDAAEIWDVTRATLAELAGRLDQPIAAVGITNQRETAVAWDKRTGRPLARAIVWQDRRTAGRCDELRDQGHLDLIRRRTGLVLDPYFTATKLEWLLTQGGVDASPHLAFGTVDSWVLWNLTGGAHATDPSNASRTLLYDIGERRWSAELCELFGVPMSALPDVLPSSGRFGTTSDGCGLPAGLPVAGIAGDQQAALFGQACVEPGMSKNTYGTGSFVLMNVGPDLPEPCDGLLTSVAWELSTGELAYALEGAVFVTGAAVQWLRDGLGFITDADEVEALARTVPDSGGVTVVPAFTGLGSPWWDPYARGTITGLTKGVGRAHIARAVLEAIAMQTRDVVDAMCAVSGREITTLRADGGAAANNLLLQMQSDILQVPVARPVVAETTALGACYLAGLAEGVWGSPAEVAEQWALDVEMRPAISASSADSRHRTWLDAVERSRNWAV